MESSTSVCLKKLENIMSACRLLKYCPEIRKLSTEFCENVKLLIDRLTEKASENPALVLQCFGELALFVTLVHLFIESLNLSQELKKHDKQSKQFDTLYVGKIKLLLESANKKMKQSDWIENSMGTIKDLKGKFQECLSELKDILQIAHLIAQDNMNLPNTASYGLAEILAAVVEGIRTSFWRLLDASGVNRGAAAPTVTSYRPDSLNEKEKQIKNLLDDMYKCKEEIERTMVQFELGEIELKHVMIDNKKKGD